MKKLIVIVCSLLFLNGRAEKALADTGIHFVRDLSWEQIKARARAENKYIFVDCYASWCAPCKWMAANIFPLKEVGEYFNTHFISVAVQMDQTSHDPKEVQQWYADAKAIDSTYAIGLYPTYLFFAPDGTAIHRLVGGVNDGKEFIARAEDVYAPGKQYYPLIGHYKEHPGDSLFLRNALTMALAIGDVANASRIGEAYMACLTNPYVKDNISLIVQLMKTSRDKVFSLFLTDPERANEGLGEKNYVQQILRIMIAGELTDSLVAGNAPVYWPDIAGSLKYKYPTLGNGDELIKVAEHLLRKKIMKQEISPLYPVIIPDANWNRITKKINARYKGIDLEQDIAEQKIVYYKYRKDTIRFEQSLTHYVRQFGDHLTNKQLNDLAWYYIFLASSNQKILTLGLGISKRTIFNYPDADLNYIDTYANLLYKTGDSSNAILWEKRALDMIPPKSGLRKEYQATLDKMQKGERTWLADPPQN